MNHANDNVPVAAGSSNLRFLSVCSGIEAASVAWPTWQAVAFSEIEKFPSAVLAHHYPDVPNLGDFTKIETTKLDRVDVLCGGTPCQAFSVAGLRRSLQDERGNLSLAFVELAHELAGLGRTDGNGLRNVVWENVVGVLSTKDNAFGCFLAGLVGADAPIVPPGKWTRHGMVAGPKGRCAWAVKDAQYFGVAQRRRRVIVVADFGNGADPAAVLFEPEGVFRHSPPSREAGEGTSADVAPSLVSSGRGVERAGDTRGQDPVVAVAFGQNRTSGPVEVSHAISAHAGPHGRQDFESETFMVQAVCATGDATREGSSQDYESTTMVAQQVYSIMPQNSGKDYKARPVAVSQPIMAGGQAHGNQGGDVVCVTGSVTHTLKAEGADASEDGTGRGTPIIAQSVAIRGREGGATAELGGEVATALRASTGGGDKPHVLAFNARQDPTHGPVADALGTRDTGHGVHVGSAVRRLTPVECERLQGFPDNYTAIPWRGKPAPECPDGPRYKALGNSWAVPLFAWLGRRIDAHMPPQAANDNTNRKESHDAAA